MVGNVEQNRFNIFNIWGKLGVTEHLGGVHATRRLIELCDIKAGQRILDIGCGTGYTACLLAKEYRGNVTAVDISMKVLAWAKKRIKKEHVSGAVALVDADAQKLPFQADSFDAVIAESVLVFCDQRKVASEAYRVLKPGGVFGINEGTYLQTPTNRLRTLLSSVTLGANIQPLLEDQWRSVLKEAGFVAISSTVRRISLWEQFKSHLRIDGVRKYFSASVQSFIDPTIRARFLNRDMFELARQFLRYLGYGLYVGRKGPFCYPLSL